VGGRRVRGGVGRPNLSLEGVGGWAGGVAQVIERLRSKCEAPSSNPSTAKNRKEKKG
jgi:hypothetical protein